MDALAQNGIAGRLAGGLALILILAAGGVGCRTGNVAAPAPPRATAAVKPSPGSGLASETSAKSPEPPRSPSTPSLPEPTETSPEPEAAAGTAGNASNRAANAADVALIASLEQQFAAARRTYDAGQLDEARAGFDQTVDRLLEANVSIPASPPLQAELNSLLDRIQVLESDVMASGGLTNAQLQTTPLDRIPELTFPLDASTRKQIEEETRKAMARGLQGSLPLVVNDAVMRYIHYFTTRGRGDFIQGYRRAGRYRAMVDRIFRQVGVPADLLYLAQLESGFNPRSVSYVGARGLWQFMAERSDGYGLQRTHWVDERMNPEKSTLAAARHLRDLHAEFGDWYLAMAAYVAGPRPVEEAVARTGYADFWKLCDMGALSRTVRDYVPVILAIAMISESPAEYGFTHLEVDPPEAVDRVPLANNLDLRLAAECAGVTLRDLQYLNPSLLHYLAPAGFVLKLPQGTGSRFTEALKVIPPGGRVTWRLHWVQPGESWGQLSRRYDISIARLAGANHLDPRHAPLAGSPLALPHGSAMPAGTSRKATRRHPAQPARRRAVKKH